MTNKIILCDVDGVLLNWMERFTTYMIDEGYSIHQDEHNQYELGKVFNISDEEALKRISTFNDGDWRFGTLQAFDGAEEAMSILSTLGYSFVAITSCSERSEVVGLRKANLYNVFGDIFKEVHCIGVNQNKMPILKKYEPTFWIEDRFRHVVEGVEAGHIGILIDRQWNQDEHHPLVMRCHSWAEIVQYIIELGGSLK